MMAQQKKIISEVIKSWYEKGMDALTEGRFTEAVDYFTKILNSDTTDKLLCDVYGVRGQAQFQLKQYRDAVNDFSLALTPLCKKYAQNDDYATDEIRDFIGVRGQSYMHLAQYDQAISDLNKVIKLAPDNDYAYYSRGECYEKKNEFVKAESDYKRAAALGNKAAINKVEKMSKAKSPH